MSDFDLNELVDKALKSKEPDPHVIARRLVARVPADHLRAVVALLLVERVKLRLRTQRVDLAPGQKRSDFQMTPAGGKSRWDRHAPRLRYAVHGEWKFYDDLSAEDCEVIATDYEARATANAALAVRFRELAAQLKASGAARIADLGDSELGEAA